MISPPIHDASHSIKLVKSPNRPVVKLGGTEVTLLPTPCHSSNDFQAPLYKRQYSAGALILDGTGGAALAAAAPGDLHSRSRLLPPPKRPNMVAISPSRSCPPRSPRSRSRSPRRSPLRFSAASSFVGELQVRRLLSSAAWSCWPAILSYSTPVPAVAAGWPLPAVGAVRPAAAAAATTTARRLLQGGTACEAAGQQAVLRSQAARQPGQACF